MKLRVPPGPTRPTGWGPEDLVHERAHLLRNYTLLVAIFVTLTTVLVKLAVSSPMKLSVCNEQSKVQTVN